MTAKERKRIMMQAQAKLNKARRYTIIEARQWHNKTSGRTASIYGAIPWTSQTEAANWHIETIGWTVKDNKNGTIGLGRRPFQTFEEAQAWIDGLGLKGDSI